MKIILTSLILCSFFLQAQQLNTPVLLERGPLNKPYTDIFGYPEWRISFWTGGYGRSATHAVQENEYSTSLAKLFFNKAQFSPKEAFAHSTGRSSSNFLLSSVLKPLLRYKEKGVMLGGDLQHYITGATRIGFRTVLPIKQIRVERLRNPHGGKSDLGGETIRDLFGEKIETIEGNRIVSFAYRLDLLSQLPYTCKSCPERNLPIVIYTDTDFPPQNPITISKQDITNQQGTPVSALRSNSSTVPQGIWAFPQTAAQALIPLAADGSLSSERGRFDASINYSALGESQTQQALLFIVPTVAQGRTTEEARVIQAHVNEVLACIDQEGEDIFKKCGISFADGCNSGIGDLDTEIYLGHFFTPCFYTEFFGGVKWATGKKVDRVQSIFTMPLGAQGHYTGKVGLQAIVKTCRWGAIHADIIGFFVSQKQDLTLASFEGAQLKNLGPVVRASTYWNSVVAHAELIITPPNAEAFGAIGGYEFFHKSRTNLRFCTPAIIDCLGTLQHVSNEVATRTSCITSHKLRGEIFVKPCDWFILSGGGSYVLSGNNAPQEREWYLSVNAYF